MITLYSTDCPRCKVLEKKLSDKGIEFNVCKDIEVMESKGLTFAPALEVDDNLMEFGDAVKWVNEV